MAHSNYFPGYVPHRATDDPSSSSSPTSSGISESPRESSISFSLMTSPTQVYDDHLSGVPKLEDHDEEESIDVKLEQSEASATELVLVPGKRPRGRPRKHPKLDPQSQSPKVTKGRSKTGCKTCRKRKKKCDERKPSCRNCEQNNVHCEGYPEKSVWQNGKEKAAARNRQRWAITGARNLPTLLPAIEEDIDWSFYHHYESNLSQCLNISPESKNPFVEIILPIAQQDEGVMHALLACSGAHYLQRLRGPGQITEYEEVSRRQSYHFQKTLRGLQEEQYGDSLDSRKDTLVICRALMLWLKTIVEGDTNGEWRIHHSGIITMLQNEPRPGEEDTWAFAREFYEYHRMSCLITCRTLGDLPEPPYIPLTTGNRENFMSVCEGLEQPTKKIHFLRRKIRERRGSEQSPYVPYNLMMEAEAIDTELKDLQCRHPVNSPEWVCWNLYHNCVWLLLQRTIMSGPWPGSAVLSTVKEAVAYLQSVGAKSPIQSVMVTPVFVVGCCAFDREDRPAVLEAFRMAEEYSHNGNIQHGRRIVQELWDLMDQGNKRAWDYEQVMEDLGMDTMLT
ncbi:hypothetical protein BT63DRAFT_453433 [Microthyrium microscopicum]|uniref:Zn(2)-C6 fungal-type domain-containing protein n=1 Tax=Microthyrium microscopicum TaxID=703497 RepID=A0A6A6UJJ4_9PEZI|nr:hypothetical protein BT63DRAFT_453433 [Microthyrium microscopicum]